MLRLRYFLLLAALLVPAAASAQTSGAPRKRVGVVAPGMTPAQVRQVLGEPLHVRHEGNLVYMDYASGCRGCGPDFVVIRDCRVVAARFESPDRRMVTAPVPDDAPPPESECRLSASEPPVAVAEPRRPPERPADTTPGGAMPADAPRVDTAPPARATIPERPLRELSPRQWRELLTLRRPTTHLLAVPASTISSPTALGVQMGEGFVGFAYQARTRFTHTNDGAAVIGLGLGDRRYLGLEVAATSYSTVRGGGPAETGGLSFKLHHAFGRDWGVAAGWENAVNWGDSDAGNSPYGVITHVARLRSDARAPFSAIATTVGVGGGRFRSEEDVVNDKETANVFGAIGIQVAEPLSLTADWNGQDLFAAVSLAPIRRLPLVINAGAADITGNAGDGVRFIVSAGLGFRWLPPFF